MDKRGRYAYYDKYDLEIQNEKNQKFQNCEKKRPHKYDYKAGYDEPSTFYSFENWRGELSEDELDSMQKNSESSSKTENFKKIEKAKKFKMLKDEKGRELTT